MYTYFPNELILTFLWSYRPLLQSWWNRRGFLCNKQELLDRLMLSGAGPYGITFIQVGRKNFSRLQRTFNFDTPSPAPIKFPKLILCCSLNKNLRTGHAVDFTTHTNELCAYVAKHSRSDIAKPRMDSYLLFPSVPSFLCLEAYHTLFYAILFLFYLFSFCSLLSFAS
jgi:hypothetical protein